MTGVDGGLRVVSRFPAQGLHLFQGASLLLSENASNTQFGLDEHYMSQQGPFICVSNPANPILGR